MSEEESLEIFPEVDTIVNFVGATAYARKIDKKSYTVKLTGGHRGQVAKMSKGYIVIEREWTIRK